jgi:DNA topoisomerase-1
MLDTGSLRIGSERYADANGSHGLSTLLCRHVTVEGDTVTLRFPAKSGQLWESDITDPDLASYLSKRLRMKRHEVVLGWEADGAWHPLAAADINAFVKQRTGSDFSAKDFRTLRGTVAAAESLAKSGPQSSQRARTRAIVQAMTDAGAVLDPRIVDRYANGETIDRSLSSGESALRAFLLGPST